MIDKKVAPELLPVITAQLQERGVELRGCPEAVELINGLIPATEEDWCTEYLDMVMAVRVVDGVEEAISTFQNMEPDILKLLSPTITLTDRDSFRRWTLQQFM